MRSRNALLQALHVLKGVDEGITMNEVIAFLYVAENEGLTVQEVAQLAGLTQSTASRSLRALGPAESGWSLPPAVGFVQASLNPDDGRSHVVTLTAQGRTIRDALDDLIRVAAPIATSVTSKQR